MAGFGVCSRTRWRGAVDRQRLVELDLDPSDNESKES